jgi:hypothetical protein
LKRTPKAIDSFRSAHENTSVNFAATSSSVWPSAK